MSTPHSRTYSEFFSSGLRAMADPPHSRISSRTSQSSPNALKTSARFNVLRTLSRHSRTPSSLSSENAPESEPSPSSKHRRRGSIIDLPARLLGRVLQSAPDSSPLSESHNQSVPSENWIYLHNPASYKKADPFGASPYSSSFFTVDLQNPDETSLSPTAPAPVPSTRQRRQSLFHLGEPTFLRLPMRSRRTSVQSLPTVSVPTRPSRPRLSSFQLQLHPQPQTPTQSRDKYDRAWPVRAFAEEVEEEVPSPSWSADSDGDDFVGSIDWRQFHAQLAGEY